MEKTFQEIAQLWCERKQDFVKYSTFCAYRLVLRSHLVPHFGELTQIEESSVQTFILDKMKGGLSKKSVRDIVAVLRAIVKFGARKGLCAPEQWELSYPTKTQARKLPVLSLRDQRKLMAHLLERPNPKNIGVLLALCTGMRIGEVCGLRWEEVDLRHRCLRVCRTVGRIYDCDRRKTARISGSPKTKHSFREIPLSKALYEALCTVKKLSATDFVVGTSAAATDPRNYRDFFARLLRRLNIPPIVFHGLRHTFATRCIESQCDYKTVSTILGHSNVATTLNLYVHPDLQQKKRCMEKMDKFIAI